MQTFETEHYTFHYGANTAAERDIEKIAVLQEGCFSHICAVLGLTPDFKIEYFLCDSPEEVGHIYGNATSPATALPTCRTVSALCITKMSNASASMRTCISSACSAPTRRWKRG